MSRWFRHYAGMMRDEKLVAVAVRTKQPVERVVWVWGAILESAAEIDDGGRYELDCAEVAYFLRTDEADILAVETGLAAAGRVAEGVVIKWSDRQYQSDKSVARQAAYRERKRAERSHADAQPEPRDVTPPSPQRHVTPQETDTDTDTEDNLKQPSPTIPREAGLRSENQDWDLLEARCREAAGWQNEPHPKLAVIGPIVELIKSGASLEMDVIPVIAAHAPKCRSRSGWAYFVGPIQDAMATRVNARAPPSVAKSQDENVANLAALQEKYGWKPGAKAQAG